MSMSWKMKLATSPGVGVLLLMALHAFADSVPCPAGKEQACEMAQYQADGYNKGVTKREGKLGFDRAVAEGEVFVIRVGVEFERKAFSDESATRETQMVNIFSSGARGLCGSEAYNLLANAGGRYETQIFDRDQKKWMTIPLDCEHPGQATANLN